MRFTAHKSEAEGFKRIKDNCPGSDFGEIKNHFLVVVLELSFEDYTELESQTL